MQIESCSQVTLVPKGRHHPFWNDDPGGHGFARDANAIHGAHIQTDAFVEALLAQELLVDQHADARRDSGQALMLRGFKIVDRVKFDTLPDALVLEWHRKGWLALIHFLSLDRFADLLARAEGAAVPAEGVTETEDA